MGKAGHARKTKVQGNPRVDLVVARFNEDITSRLRDSAIRTLVKAGVKRSRIKVWEVPGSLEIPQVAARLAKKGGPDALIGIGCIIRGGTAHHEHVARVALDNLGRLGLSSPFPVIACILTVESEAQALERADGSLADRGAEAASAAIHMIALVRSLQGPGAGT